MSKSERRREAARQAQLQEITALQALIESRQAHKEAKKRRENAREFRVVAEGLLQKNNFSARLRRAYVKNELNHDFNRKD